MKTKIFLILLIIQISLIIVLSKKIYLQRQSILSAVNINPISKDAIVFQPSGQLKYFYEPKASTTENVMWWVPYKGIYTINKDSLNEQYDYEVKKPSSTYRIITLGDSFTYGLYVDTNQNWTELLENKLNNSLKCNNFKKIEVINLGVHGYDLRYSVERYKIRGIKYNPDLVLWFLKDDDFMQINEYLLPEKTLHMKIIKENGEYEQYIKNEQYNFGWLDIANNFFSNYGENKIIQYQSRALDEFSQYFKKKLLIFTFSATKKQYKVLMKKYSQIHQNVYVIADLINTYKDASMHFLKDSHPNQKGHEVIANYLFEKLTKENIIPCEK